MVMDKERSNTLAIEPAKNCCMNETIVAFH